ncbi:4-hydroxy-3-methylbut-2-enyl diphosphate reductase [Cerasicoccus fimbriatus]|uniref:4-hydroxy-3-methylbut-2-enyl diphosphate reductase n=1 Tax=Cerasicoccus fimbriatus TaxID=3014554 RepID=UPI0022B317C7|nr:4-hydroxy-3-methylbut-2-enyl diphosphate reductase [Cerasicoccus sp. TK19100]
MEVIRADSAGFCWGVERAIDIAAKFAAEGKRPVYTDGPLIHNKQMMERLEATGIKEVGDYQSKSDLTVSDEDKENGVLVVRAHGISPERREYLKSLGMNFKDATCPDVGIIAGKIKMHARKGFDTVIFGDPKHPEVMGLMGYTEGRGHVVKNDEDIRALPDSIGPQVCMVSQSTMFTDEFERLSNILRERFPEAKVFDTICGATKERQSDIHVLMNNGAEAIVVVGGRHSANTKKLAALVEKTGLPAYHVETVAELDITHLHDNYNKVGVTAGASTPEFLIKEVVEKLQSA